VAVGKTPTLGSLSMSTTRLSINKCMVRRRQHAFKFGICFIYLFIYFYILNIDHFFHPTSQGIFPFSIKTRQKTRPLRAVGSVCAASQRVNTKCTGGKISPGGIINQGTQCVNAEGMFCTARFGKRRVCQCAFKFGKRRLPCSY
jgi:hypothetical protein